MKNRRQIEEELSAHVEIAKRKVKLARSVFTEIITDIPSGLPSPDGALRISNAGKEERLAQEDLRVAVFRLNDFLFRGVIPDEYLGK